MIKDDITHSRISANDIAECWILWLDVRGDAQVVRLMPDRRRCVVSAPLVRLIIMVIAIILGRVLGADKCLIVLVVQQIVIAENGKYGDRVAHGESGWSTTTPEVRSVCRQK